MNRILTAEEVEKLFEFVKSKYVPYVDVQFEIVDHLACAIEDEFATNPSINFQQALNKVYSKFPITGFVHFVEQKQKALTKYWRRRLFQTYMEFLTTSKVKITILYVSTFVLGVLYLGKTFVFYSGSLLFFLSLLSMYKSDKNIKKMKRANDKLLVSKIFVEMTRVPVFLPILFFDFFEVRYAWGQTSPSACILTIITFVFTWQFIACYISYFQTKEIIQKELDDKYKHVKDRLAIA